MYVCVCNAVTDTDIRNAVEDGVRNFKQLSRLTGCSDTCGSCQEMALDVLQQAVSDKRQQTYTIPVLQMA